MKWLYINTKIVKQKNITEKLQSRNFFRLKVEHKKLLISFNANKRKGKATVKQQNKLDLNGLKEVMISLSYILLSIVPITSIRMDMKEALIEY